MSPTQVAAVQPTFSLVVPIKEQAAAIFYERLFSIDPTTKPLFTGDIKVQGRMLMSALATVAGGLNNPSSNLPTVQALGRRHVGYRVKDEHYASVGAALLWTLEKGFGDEFTPDVKGAWADAYGLLAGVMKDAAAQGDRA
jgi:nitric oxide dioxygenase